MPDPIEITIPEKLRPLIPKFLERTNEAVAQLRAALAAGDAKTLQDIGHRLRGTAGGYGFGELGELAKQLEEAAKAGNAAAYPALVSAMSEHLARVTIRYT
jgi:HPt (histidine-containing phosphotransfer) domain-containing protein